MFDDLDLNCKMLGHRKPDRVLCVKLAKLCIHQPVVFLDYIQDEDLKDVYKISLDTLLFLFIICYEELCEKLEVVLVPIEDETKLKSCRYFEMESNLLNKFKNVQVQSICGSISEPLTAVKRPSVFVKEDKRIISGLCASIRFVLLHLNRRTLLGFRSSCLNCCAQASLWTKFCERDVPTEVINLDTTQWRLSSESPVFPQCLLLLENQLLQPVRTHNVSLVKKRLHTDALEHTFVEGVELTLADMLIFLCVHIMFKEMTFADFSRSIPNVKRWHRRVLDIVKTKPVGLFLSQRIVSASPPTPATYDSKLNSGEKVVIRNKDSFPTLYLLERKYPSRRVENVQFHKDLPWHMFPELVRPEAGGLPDDRIIRKRQQISNIVNAVTSLVDRANLKIVDFCSGGGHVGIVLAYLLPECTVCLVENKFESLFNAQKRAKDLGLVENLYFYQCNLDCFTGKFDIGVSLHACGGATDMVIDKCVESKASFVSIPCCYGSIGSESARHFQLKTLLEEIKDEPKAFQELCHYADRNISRDGDHAMDAVDTDRLLSVEGTGHYKAILTKILPTECTPKNNMIIARCTLDQAGNDI